MCIEERPPPHFYVIINFLVLWCKQKIFFFIVAHYLLLLIPGFKLLFLSKNPNYIPLKRLHGSPDPLSSLLLHPVYQYCVRACGTCTGIAYVRDAVLFVLLVCVASSGYKCVTPRVCVCTVRAPAVARQLSINPRQCEPHARTRSWPTSSSHQRVIPAVVGVICIEVAIGGWNLIEYSWSARLDESGHTFFYPGHAF